MVPRVDGEEGIPTLRSRLLDALHPKNVSYYVFYILDANSNIYGFILHPGNANGEAIASGLGSLLQTSAGAQSGHVGPPPPFWWGTSIFHFC